MAWSPQARRAAALARKRKAKPKYGVARNGKKMTAAQRKRAGANRSGKRNAKRNARIDRKIKKVQTKATKKIDRKIRAVQYNTYTNGKEYYTNAYGIRAYQKGAKIGAKANKKIAKLKAKKRKAARKR